MRHGIEEVVVVVPAHDEHERVGALVASVAASARHLRSGAPSVCVRILVVADGCSDATAAVARSRGAEVLELDRRGVGAARAAGIAHVLASALVPHERLWIANTDADSVVPSDWLLAHIEHARRHDALLGTVRPDPADLAPEAYGRWRETREREEAVGSIHGANLGVRASAYLAAGGFGTETLHEDVRLVERLRTTGARVGASDRGEVVTSGRRDNRVSGGYGRYLHERFAGDEVTASA
ncbi:MULTISPECIES: glycosyltransferase [unclassified Rathayibacter]|uniref:glycosyltransferase n=1 Tax=unclassified Rathayibacter TaxID=2609250 RepID=UPI00188B6AD5|nr:MULTISPECIES: glycosyltransferase [unclassified Rathayibacter]MBF4462965.1 glycosyltransferase [Rathayibacter sp. VKM Ac-2879]MBF4504379.1 glycosyltransferase [Rathayibacter sp. VKM Ac-2878]